MGTWDYRFLINWPKQLKQHSRIYVQFITILVLCVLSSLVVECLILVLTIDLPLLSGGLIQKGDYNVPFPNLGGFNR